MHAIPVERLFVIHQNCPDYVATQKNGDQRRVRSSTGGLHRKAAGSLPQPLGHHRRVAKNKLILAPIAVPDTDAVVGIHPACRLPDRQTLLKAMWKQLVIGS